MSRHHHFLILSCPGQGHLNPTLELAKRLTRLLTGGTHVTLATTVHGLRRITTLPTLDGLSYASFSDGYDDGPDPAADTDLAMAEYRRVGSQTLAQLLTSFSDDGRPVTFVIYSVLLPWAAAVAREHHVPSAFLSIQSASAFAIYHRFFNTQNGLYPDKIDPSISIKLPGLPPFSSDEIPCFLLPNSPYAAVIPTFQEHIQTLEKDPNHCILLNTFDQLEQDAIRAVHHMNLIPIGPLVPTDQNPSTIDLFERGSVDYLQWLDSKTEGSVIYVSFGSMVVLNKSQIEEIFHGLVKFRSPFLWVIRKADYEGEIRDLIEANLNEEDGLIVPWCSQPEVLSHGSIGCFLTHCGWNSVLESIVAGVPVVGCPQWSDQFTNAKLVDEVWGIGVRAAAAAAAGGGGVVVEREEIRRCLEVVMGGGERGEEIRRNCAKWKGLGVEAVGEGGPAHNNLKQFLDRLG